MKFFLSCVVILISISSIIAAESRLKVANYNLDVEFFPSESSLKGMAAVTFTAPSGSDNLDFYLHGELRVDSVKTGNLPLKYAQDLVLYEYEYSMIALKTSVKIPAGTKLSTLKIYYHGPMHPSQVSALSNYMRIDDDGVFLRAYGYSLWFPLFIESQRAVYSVDFGSVRLVTPEEFTTVFVGHHLEDSLLDGKRVSRWRAEDVNLFAPQCTSYRFTKKQLGKINIYSWQDSASLKAADDIAGFVSDIISRYTDLYKPYTAPGEFHIVEMPQFGDIASGNMIGITYDLWQNFNSENFPRTTLAHELVHGFVQLEIDRDDPFYAMDIEGFPAYFHLPVLEEFFGREWYDGYMKRMESRYLTQKQTGKNPRGEILAKEIPLDQIGPDEIGEYKDWHILGNRNRLFFNYLRVKMGDPEFKNFCRDLFGRESLTYDTFKKVVLAHAPKLAEDLTTWLSTTDYPERFHLKNLK